MGDSRAEVDELNGVGHGTTLSGRYRLEERLLAEQHGAFWRAVDQTLDRAVGVRVLGSEHPHRGEVLDAARRAALVEDPRLLRVLDVGVEDGTTFVISEYVDVDNLARALSRGELPVDHVREVVGEAAEALERARMRGLHHLCLTPSSLIRIRSGDVKVVGLAVEAAVAGVQPQDADAASRTDTEALVAVLYAGLTGRWPHGDVDELPAAPQVGGQPVPPGDLVPGVPNDLDTLCSVVLGPHGDGPRTPGELAQQLAPWGLDTTGSGAAVAVGDLAPAGRPHTGASPAGPSGHDRLKAGPEGTGGGEAGDQRDDNGEPDEDDQSGGGAQRGRSAAGMRPARPVLRSPAGTAGQARTDARAGGAAPAGRGAGASAGTGSTAVASRSTGAPRAAAGPAATFDIGGFAVEEEHYDDEPPGRGQGRLVLAVVAAVVLLGLVLAVNSLRSIGEGGDDPGTAAEPTVTASPTPTTSEPLPTTSTPTTTTPTVPPPSAVGIQALDPLGDGDENGDVAPRAIDGDPSTLWNSSTYTTADFGGLKPGLGMLIDLGDPSQVSGATLTMPGSGGTFELRSADNPAYEGSEVVATGEISGGTVEVELDEPVQTPYLVIWFTRLPEIDGDFRVEVAEVQLR